jgi:3-methyladenine DNA glycosylase AlkD
MPARPKTLPRRDPLQTRIRDALAAVADPAKAAPMQAYMKSSMPYYGVPAPLLRAVCKEVLTGVTFEGPEAWQNQVLAIWRGAKKREERYAAIALTGLKRAAPFQTMDALPMYEELIVTGAWWDFVDEIAARRLGPLLRAFPRPMAKAMRAWSRSDDMWKRRSAILCQLTFKGETDRALLYECIERAIGSKEFFLRKAIGWALRQYARVEPAEVARYVRAHEAELSPLSKREALKHIGD